MREIGRTYCEKIEIDIIILHCLFINVLLILFQLFFINTPDNPFSLFLSICKYLMFKICKTDINYVGINWFRQITPIYIQKMYIIKIDLYLCTTSLLYYKNGISLFINKLIMPPQNCFQRGRDNNLQINARNY